jgi:hypothetical protein
MSVTAIKHNCWQIPYLKHFGYYFEAALTEEAPTRASNRAQQPRVMFISSSYSGGQAAAFYWLV